MAPKKINTVSVENAALKKEEVVAESIEKTTTQEPISEKEIPEENSLGQWALFESAQNVPSSVDLDKLRDEIKHLASSPNPFVLYSRGNALREQFSNFLNQLAKQISDSFSVENKSVLASIYYDGRYHEVWAEFLRRYLEQSRYFDYRLYFRASILFDKELQTLAKGLLKLVKKESDEMIVRFLGRYKTKTEINRIHSVYRDLRMASFVEKIPAGVCDEQKIERFLEWLALQKGFDTVSLFEIFPVAIKTTRDYFGEIFELFGLVTRSYIKDFSSRTVEIRNYVMSRSNESARLKVEELVSDFADQRSDFFIRFMALMKGKSTLEIESFRSYVSTLLIDSYFSEVKMLFYWNDYACSNRNEWSRLRGNFHMNENNRNLTQIKELLAFKNMILEIEKNLIAPFLKPFIYSVVSEQLGITRKEFLKLRYVVTLVLAENYREYKTVFNFFEDLEVFLELSPGNGVWGMATSIATKLKIFAAPCILLIATLVLLFMYAPIGVFVGVLLLALMAAKENLFPFRAGIEWNLGLKTFATVLLAVSSFFWMTNLDKTKTDVITFTSKVEKLGVYRTSETVKRVTESFSQIELPSMMADIFWLSVSDEKKQ